MGWLSKLFNLDIWTEQNLGAVPNPIPKDVTSAEAKADSDGAQSKTDAKNRLKLVLMHDRSQLSSEVLEKMRLDLVEVISRYVEIDQDALEINLESESNTIALVANIPMMKMRAAQGKAAQQQEDESKTEDTPANVKGKTGTEEDDDAAEDLVDDLIQAVEASEKAEKAEPPVKKAGQ